MNPLSFAALASVLAITLARPVEKKPHNSSTEIVSSDDNFETAYAKPFAIFQPKVLVINMFKHEASPWLSALDFEHNITIPGLSPVYPTIFCTSNYSICEMTTGEGEINAASSVTALGLSPLFDLSHTYFLISGIAGGEPNYTTLGSVTYAKYAVQVDLEYEVAYQDFIGADPAWKSGFWAYDTDGPGVYPGSVYGTEVFEVNSCLRERAVDLAETATLSNGSDGNAQYRLLYEDCAARGLPTIVKGDVLTGNNYYTGGTLGDYFGAYASLLTNGSSKYVSVAQEDNASLEAFTRLAKYGLVDFDRIVIQRSISDFTRPPPSKANDTVSWFNNPRAGGSSVAFTNLPIAGLPFVRDILQKWDDVYWSGEKYSPKNYTGDILDSLGGTPDFGKSSFDIAY